jgi:FAD/FMN-containing dehydrogenase
MTVRSTGGGKVRKHKTPNKKLGRATTAAIAVNSETTKTRNDSQTSSITTTSTKNPPPILKRNPLGHLLIEKMLREAGFRGGISSDKSVLERYSTDESIFHVRPQVVIQPKSPTDVEIATQVIARETKRFTSLSLTPRAAGTGLSGGSLTDSIVIDVCAHLNQIDDVKVGKSKSTITCEPGAMWRTVEKKLKSHGLYLPPYTASKDICSIGGSIANNAAGPDSLRYGHCADWVESLRVVLSDGKTYTIKPLNYKEMKSLVKEKHEHARLVREVYSLIEMNEVEIKKNQPKTHKNSAGYSLWHVLPDGIAAFKKGKGQLDLTRLFSGSQGTIGIITSITLRTEPIADDTTLIAIPIFELADTPKVITRALEYKPINVELFDALSFDLALKHPEFFKKRLSGLQYYRTMLALYTSYHVRYARKLPDLTILITLDKETTTNKSRSEIVKSISTDKTRARVVSNPCRD